MTTATANKVKTPKKGFKLDRQMIPTLAAVVIFILMIIMGVVRHLHSTGLHLLPVH